LPVNLEKAGLGCWREPSQHDWLGFFCGLVLVFDLNEGVIVEIIVAVEKLFSANFTSEIRS
jgi:hypothetical protein